MAQRNTGARSKKKSPVDAIQMLEADHRKVEKLFQEFLNGDAGRQPQLAQEIFRELEVHSTLEEEVFYPALQQPDKLTDEELDSVEDLDSEISDEDETEEMESESEETVDESTADTVASAYDEHRMVRDQITRLRQMEGSAPEFRQGMVELQGMVSDHVSVEEDELFTQAQLSVDTKTLGQQMQKRRADILSAAA